MCPTEDKERFATEQFALAALNSKYKQYLERLSSFQASAEAALTRRTAARSKVPGPLKAKASRKAAREDKKAAKEVRIKRGMVEESVIKHMFICCTWIL